MTFSTKARLYALLALAVGSTIAVGTIGYRSATRLSAVGEEALTIASALSSHQDADMMHDALRGDVLAALLAESEKDKTQVVDDLREHSEQFRRAMGENKARGLPGEVSAALGGIEGPLEGYIRAAEELVTLAAKDKAGARERLGWFLEQFGVLEERMGVVSEQIEKANEATVRKQGEIRATARASIVTIWVASVGVMLVLGVWIAGTLSSRIGTITRRLREIAAGEGDLEARVIELKDGTELGEVARSFNLFACRVTEIVRNVSDLTDAVCKGATTIAAASEQGTSSLANQQREVSEIAGAADELAGAAQEVASNSAAAAEAAKAARETATRGNRAVEQTIASMTSIAEAVSSGAQSVSTLGARSEQIGKIIGVINDIADQTNLLALNAAIEAARAGVHGRGFAVVADEVRKLAERTTRATKEVADSIRQIQDETRQAVERIHAGSTQVESGVELATHAKESLGQIVESVERSAEMITSIANVAARQADLGEQIKERIRAMEASASEAHSGASSTATSAAELTSRAQGLQAVLDEFRKDRAAA